MEQFYLKLAGTVLQTHAVAWELSECSTLQQQTQCCLSLSKHPGFRVGTAGGILLATTSTYPIGAKQNLVLVDLIPDIFSLMFPLDLVTLVQVLCNVLILAFKAAQWPTFTRRLESHHTTASVASSVVQRTLGKRRFEPLGLRGDLKLGLLSTGKCHLVIRLCFIIKQWHSGEGFGSWIWSGWGSSLHLSQVSKLNKGAES